MLRNFVFKMDEKCRCPFVQKYTNFSDGTSFTECGLDEYLETCDGNLDKRPVWCHLRFAQTLQYEGAEGVEFTEEDMKKYRKMWYTFKKYILSQNSHGKNALTSVMNQMEVDEFS